jgi:hypothetical protein
MGDRRYYRGGPSLAPTAKDYRIDKNTGLLSTGRGVSVRDVPTGLESFGGAYEVGPLPPELHAVQIGKDPHHFEVAPAVPMTLDEFSQALGRLTLVPV